MDDIERKLQHKQIAPPPSPPPPSPSPSPPPHPPGANAPVSYHFLMLGGEGGEEGERDIDGRGRRGGGRGERVDEGEEG